MVRSPICNLSLERWSLANLEHSLYFVRESETSYYSIGHFSVSGNIRVEVLASYDRNPPKYYES